MFQRALSPLPGSGGVHTESFFRALSSEYYLPNNTKVSSDGTFTLCSSYDSTASSVMATVAKKCKVIIKDLTSGVETTDIYNAGDNIIAMGSTTKYSVMLIDI